MAAARMGLETPVMAWVQYDGPIAIATPERVDLLAIIEKQLRGTNNKLVWLLFGATGPGYTATCHACHVERSAERG